MKIKRLNESVDDLLYIRGVYSEFKIDVKEHFDLVFVDLIDQYYKSSIIGDVTHTTYIIEKSRTTSSGFDGVRDIFQGIINDIDDIQDGYEHIISEFKNDTIFSDYPKPKITYTLIKELSGNSVRLGIKINLYYSLD